MLSSEEGGWEALTFWGKVQLIWGRVQLSEWTLIWD